MLQLCGNSESDTEGVTVRLPDGDATILDGVWSCSNRETLQVVRALRLEPGHHADRDRELADRVVCYLGGIVADDR
jgi:hypothetical protein